MSPCYSSGAAITFSALVFRQQHKRARALGTDSGRRRWERNRGGGRMGWQAKCICMSGGFGGGALNCFPDCSWVRAVRPGGRSGRKEGGGSVRNNEPAGTGTFRCKSNHIATIWEVHAGLGGSGKRNRREVGRKGVKLSVPDIFHERARCVNLIWVKLHRGKHIFLSPSWRPNGRPELATLQGL